MKQLVSITFAICLLSGCGPSRAQKMMAERMTQLRYSQELWNECQVDPTCTGDEMAKKRMQLTDAQASVDRLNAIETQYVQQSFAALDQTQANVNSVPLYQPWNPAPPITQSYSVAPTYVPRSGAVYLPTDTTRHGGPAFAF